ncbi:MAG: biopolymer transporter ExbD [Pseudomonadota bacterium]
MRKRPPRPKAEPTIALINIVFLMLIFFMVAGTLAAPLDPELTLVETRELDRREPPTALVLMADGTILFRGSIIDGVQDYVSTLDEEAIAQVVPDRAVPAAALLMLARNLQEAGAQKVMIVTEQALQ